MGRAKEIIVKVIPAKIANEFVKKHHYSGKSVNSVLLSFGCFLDEKLHGVLQYGNPLSKKLLIGLVKNTKWNEFLELNRMAFDEYLPKYSESRCIAISIRLIKKQAPHIKWIVSFADATQCGDGTIYRASGFYLTAINQNKGIIKMPDGLITHTTAFNPMGNGSGNVKRKYNWQEGKSKTAQFKQLGVETLEGYQLRYIYLIDRTCKITVPILPFSKIDEMGAGMYKGENVTLESRKNKHAEIAHLGERCISNTEGAFDATVRLNKTDAK